MSIVQSLRADSFDHRRRRVLFALGALPVAGVLASVPRRAFADSATNATVIQGRDNWLYPGWESLTDDKTSACAATMKTIQAAVQTMNAHGMHCIVVIAPLKARACAANLPEGTALAPAVQGRYAALKAQAAELGVDMVDGDAALAAAGTADTPFIRADYHWSAHTAEAFAQSASGLLRATGGLDSQNNGTKLGAWNEEVRYGDLAALLPPDEKKAVGKDHFIVRTSMNQASAAGLLDATPDVQVVGNSMVQPYLGFPQKLSNALGRPVGLTWTFGDTGPWKTLLNYVETPGFASQKPKAIVWQFNEGQMMNGPHAQGQWDAASVMTESAWMARLAKALG